MSSKVSSVWLCTLLLIFAATVPGVSAQQADNADSSKPENDCQLPVVVVGAVAVPSRFELRRRVRLRELVALVGGATGDAKGTINIVHTIAASACENSVPDNSGKPFPENLVETYNLSDLQKHTDDKANPYLRPGDYVSVPVHERVYVLGSVAIPQALYLGESLTLTQALAMVGGVLKNANTERIVISRPHCFDMRKIIYANLNEIKDGRQQDIPLQPYDIVDVRDKRGWHSGPTIHIKPEVFAIEEKLSPLRIIY